MFQISCIRGVYQEGKGQSGKGQRREDSWCEAHLCCQTLDKC